MPTTRKKASKTKASAQTTHLSRAQRTAILKALADPRRFALMERIAKAARPVGCAEARTALAISAATLSHHVKELETVGLVRVEREGKYIYLTPRCEVWQELLASLAAIGQSKTAGRRDALIKIDHRSHLQNCLCG
jgi:ArsR family transcriptional regulator